MPKAPNYLVPIDDIAPFLKLLEFNGHDIDTIDNATLRKEWASYCAIKVEGGEA